MHVIAYGLFAKPSFK